MAGYSTDASIAGSDELSGSGSDLSIQRIWAAVRRRWWVAVAVFIVVLAAGIWRTLSTTPLYSASATVRVSQQQAMIPGVQGPQTFQDYRVDRLLAETQVIKSAEVARRVVEALGLHFAVKQPEDLRRIDLFGVTRPVVRGAPPGEYRIRLDDATYSLSGPDGALGSAAYGDSLVTPGLKITLPNRPAIEGREVVLQLMSAEAMAPLVQGSIGTNVLDKTDIIQISATMTDRYVAMDVANGVATAYAEFSREAMENQARAKSTFIASQLDMQEDTLMAAQQARKEFLENNNLTDVSSEQAAIAGRIFEAEANRQAAMLERSNYRSVLGELDVADTTTEKLRRLVGSGTVITNPAVKDLYDKWFEFSTKRQEMEANRVNQSIADVGALDQQIAATKRNLQTAVNDYYEQLNQRIASYDNQIEAGRKDLSRFPTLAADDAQLQARERTLQRIYDDLQREYQLARIAENGAVAMVRPIDSATLPIAPVSPDRRRDAIMAAVLGVLLGVGAAVLLDRLDDSVRSPDEIATQLNLPVLGMIPAIKIDAEGRAASMVTMERLVTHANPRSPVAEAYRSLRTNLAFARAREEIKTLVLTSPGPADGKSTTVANLAITFAQQGQRTLLIDADLRRAVLDKTFSVPRSPGLTEVIVGETELSAAVNETAVPNLYVLGSGHFPPNPSELLGSSAMRNVLREAKEQFDVILFDSPPLLAVTDAAVLATMVDGTVIVVRMGATARQAVRRAIGQLHAVHGRVLGAVMNDVDLRRSGYYGGYGYAYYAYYGSEANGNGGHSGVMDRLRRVTNWTSAGPRGR